MDLNLQGKKVFITGASDGLGEAMAIMMAKEGAIIGVHGRDQAKIDNVIAHINEIGGQAFGFAADLLDKKITEELGHKVIEQMGQIDIFIANAGGGGDNRPTSWEQNSDFDYEQVFQLNFHSPVSLIKLFAPLMMARNFGRIILVSSAAAFEPIPMQPAYGAAKAALLNLNVSTAKWLGDSGVTCNAICPGAILTNALKGYLERTASARGWEGSLEEIEAKAVKSMFKIPVGRVGRPHEVASLACYLASEFTGFITGACYVIDGGVIGTVH